MPERNSPFEGGEGDVFRNVCMLTSPLIPLQRGNW